MEFEFFLVPLKFENAEIEDISESIPTLILQTVLWDWSIPLSPYQQPPIHSDSLRQCVSF